MRVTRDGGMAALEGEDGARYVVRPHVAGEFRLDPAGGAPELVLDRSDPLRRTELCLDARDVYLWSADPGGRPTPIERVELASGGTTRLPGLALERDGTSILGLSVAPDARAVLFTRIEIGDSDLVRVEGFR